MKIPLVTAILLVLAGAAFAGDIEKFAYAETYCRNHHTDAKGGEVGKTKKYCDAAPRLRKKLKAQGYCFFGKGGVGRPSKDGKHCYTL